MKKTLLLICLATLLLCSCGGSTGQLCDFCGAREGVDCADGMSCQTLTTRSGPIDVRMFCIQNQYTVCGNYSLGGA